MDLKIKNELTWKNTAIVAGIILTIIFWKAVLTIGLMAGIGWFLWKNRERIKNHIRSSGKNS